MNGEHAIADPPTQDRRRFDGALFDLDGVLTDTAALHARCWKQLFDEFLRRRAASAGSSFTPFDITDDYRRHVDGRPRLEGARAFLRSRGIELAAGGPEDARDEPTLHTLAERKNALFRAALAEDGVRPYDDAIALLRAARAAGMRTAVVTSSRNALPVLRAVGLEALLDARVDGNVAAREGLAGKPAPDAFRRAAEMLGVAPARAFAVEDATAGVRAARAAGVALVIGVDRVGRPDALRDAGAHVVVDDLALVIDRIAE